MQKLVLRLQHLCQLEALLDAVLAQAPASLAIPTADGIITPFADPQKNKVCLILFRLPLMLLQVCAAVHVLPLQHADHVGDRLEEFTWHMMALQKVVKGGKGKKKEETPEEAEAGEEEHAQEDGTKENMPPSSNSQVQATEHSQGRCVPRTLLSLALPFYLLLQCCIASSTSTMKGQTSCKPSPYCQHLDASKPEMLCRLKLLQHHLRSLSASAIRLMMQLPRVTPCSMALAPQAYLLSGLLDATQRHLSNKSVAPFGKAQQASHTGVLLSASARMHA